MLGKVPRNVRYIYSGRVTTPMSPPSRTVLRLPPSAAAACAPTLFYPGLAYFPAVFTLLSVIRNKHPFQSSVPPFQSRLSGLPHVHTVS